MDLLFECVYLCRIQIIISKIQIFPENIEHDSARAETHIVVSYTLHSGGLIFFFTFG